jgi:hypothetical protein
VVEDDDAPKKMYKAAINLASRRTRKMVRRMRRKHLRLHQRRKNLALLKRTLKKGQKKRLEMARKSHPNPNPRSNQHPRLRPKPLNRQNPNG